MLRRRLKSPLPVSEEISLVMEYLKPFYGGRIRVEG